MGVEQLPGLGPVVAWITAQAAICTWFLRPPVERPVYVSHATESSCDSELRHIIDLQNDVAWWKLLAIVCLVVIGGVLLLALVAGVIACKCVRCWCCRRETPSVSSAPIVKAIVGDPAPTSRASSLVVTPSSRKSS